MAAIRRDPPSTLVQPLRSAAAGCTFAPRRDAVVFHVNGEFFALLNRCPHAGAPLDKAATFPVHFDSYVIIET